MSLTLADGQSVATMLAVAVVAILLAAAFYRRAFGTLPAGKFAALLGLRAAAILLVVTLLFRPVLSYQASPSERPSLVFLLDTSASMSISDDAGGVSRFDRARERLVKWSGRLDRDFRLRIMVFAEQADLVEGTASLASLTPTGSATSFSRAMWAVSRQFSPKEVAAVVLLSDGIDNTAGNPVAAARTTGMTVHAIGVGASLRDNPSYRDIQVTGIDSPDHLVLNNMARVTGSIDAVGLAGRVIQPILEEDDKPVAQAELTLDDAEGSQRVTFEFRPTVKGRHTYTVRVEPVEGEKIVQNNQRSATAMVTEAGIRVLYLEGTLRGEYGALVNRFLAKDPDVEFCAMIQTRPNVFSRRTNIDNLKFSAIPKDQETIDRFDVFILGDIDSTYLRPQQQEMFVKRIRAGAGLIMLGGYHSLGPGGYAGTPLGNILPVKLGGRSIGQYTDSFLPLLTPDGAHHPIFANIAGFFPTQQGKAKQAGLPLLDGCTRVEGARPGATVLATLPAAGGEMPVLAVQPVDRGRTAVFTADTTRKWQQGPRALGQDSPFLRFWGQMVRWLAGRKEMLDTHAGIDATADKTVYQPGETIRLSAVVRNRDGQGAEGAKVEAVVKEPLGNTERVSLAPVPGPSGHYAGVLEPRLAGRYEIVVQSRLGDLSLGSEKLPIEVGRPNLEFERLDLDEKTLAAIASSTGGRCVSLSAADYFIDQLRHDRQKKTLIVERQLYWPPAVWTLFVALVTAEWILRRRYQLR